MYHTELRGGKSFAAEKKIYKILLRSKRFKKMKKNRIKPNELIKNVAENMNNAISPKYGLSPEKIEERSLDPNDGKYFQEFYDFVRLRKIQNNQIRNDKYNNQKIDRRKRTLRSPLNLTENFQCQLKDLEKKDAPGRLYKSSTENMPFFNRNRICTIYKRAKLENGTYLYWLEEDGQKVKGRFLRQELFALDNQFIQ